MQCTTEECDFTLNPEVCNYCIHPNTDYTFSVAAVLSDSQLGPAITVNKKIGKSPYVFFPSPTVLTTTFFILPSYKYLLVDVSSTILKLPLH